jgi:GMP synthase (glutamine-hydrolysing)
MLNRETILIIDFGSQYTQLIARRVRESKVYCEIHSHKISIEEIKRINPIGIILSGGPMSVYDDSSPGLDNSIISLNKPILGICYGLQILCKNLGGKVESAKDREYGKAELVIEGDSPLFLDVENDSTVWMSHGDYLTDLPQGFVIIGTSHHSPICAIENTQQKIYGVQFHPEVVHTEEGNKIISNFLFKICDATGNWTSQNFIDESTNKIKSLVGNSKVICALSGGVDSTVAAVLLDKAIGDKLVCIHIDNGLMRKNESENVEKLFRDEYHIHFIHVNAAEKFLHRLKGVTDPEQKRKIIGNTFIEVFEDEAKKIDGVEFLVQGTLYPDVIESVSVKGASATIKTHHNVGGLPEKMHLKLIEPFRELFKDEVRDVGRSLNIPEEFIERHPFPGPGLAVRIIGDVTEEKLNLLRDADDIFINEIKTAGVYNNIWQAFSVLLPIQTVGVMGDARTYENVLALRAVTSVEGMTADWYRFDGELLAKTSNKIINKIRGINRVVYDISSKPPSTIEWE